MRSLALAAAALFTAGCGAILHGTSQNISIQTDPPGATARAGSATCTTPGYLVLPRSVPATIEISKPGYETVHVPVRNDVDAVIIGDVCLGLWPLIIDLVTGGMYTLEPEYVNVKLNPGGGLGYAPQPAPPYAPAPQQHGAQPAPPPPPPPQAYPPPATY